MGSNPTTLLLPPLQRFFPVAPLPPLRQDLPHFLPPSLSPFRQRREQERRRRRRRFFIFSPLGNEGKEPRRNCGVGGGDPPPLFVFSQDGHCRRTNTDERRRSPLWDLSSAILPYATSYVHERTLPLHANILHACPKGTSREKRGEGNN